MGKCWEKRKECWDKKKPLTKILLQIVVLALVIGLISFIFICCESTWSFIGEETSEQEVNAWLYFITGLATGALAIIACIQLKKLNDNSTEQLRNNEAQFLLRIDERWGSSEILEARTIIHKMYVTIPPFFGPHDLERKKEQEKEKVDNLGIQIKDMSFNKISQVGEDFIKILNFMDFMETIGFLCKEDHVTAEKLETLCGESLQWNYSIFKCYIEHKREKRSNPGYYKNFEDLCKALENKQTKP